MEIIILHSEDEKTMEKVIFLDRDGTLNAEVNYLHRPEDLQLLPGVPEALRRLKEAGYKLVVVTNQAGVARSSKFQSVSWPPTSSIRAATLCFTL